MTTKTLIQRAITDLAQAEQAYRGSGQANDTGLYLASQAARELLSQALVMMPDADRRFEAAKAAMQGELSSQDLINGVGVVTRDTLPRSAEYWVQCADALLNALNRGTATGGNDVDLRATSSGDRHPEPGAV